MIDGHIVYESEPNKIKDGYRYNFKLSTLRV